VYSFKHITARLLPAAALASLALTAGCIKNDIPYPRIQPNFNTFEVVDASQPASIDTVKRIITVYLGEDADIYNVQVNKFGLSPSDAVWPDSTTFINGVDLSSPVNFTVSLYQDYTWQVNAVQQIERYFTFGQQIGSSSIDPVAHRVVAYINSKASIDAVNVETLKLAGPSATVTPSLAGTTVDFTKPVEVTVSQHGHDTKWTIYVEPTDAEVTTERVDAWTCVAWLYGSAEAGKDNGFEYRRADSDVWTSVPDAWVTHNGGSFSARLIHLDPLTAYVARATSGSSKGEDIMFTTGATATIPNGNFNEWWLNGKVWCPWAQDGTSWWDTGNRGATTLGDSNSTPTDDTPDGDSGRAARLETRFVGIGPLGKLAAGNIFAGTYVRTDGTNGILSFGRPFAGRPTKVKGWMKYTSAPISSTTSGFEKLKNQPDTCIIWCALIDSEQPFEIRTNPNNRHLFDSNGPEVIAYGKVESGKSIMQYQQFEITLDYVSTSRVPRYLLLVASASKYGDYFTGGNGSVLYLDNLTLDFDY